ncbi:MAG: restriction endonuclease subunit S [Gammaproteobacteria bacterium]|nr:restriction endonuclease subunit S [Gammaproteobacteria bacterium]
MKWTTTTIQRVSQQTQVCNPRERQESLFKYIDISSIDRDKKIISQAPEIKGAKAPSRARKEVNAGDILVSTVRPNLNAVAIVPPELDSQIASTGFSVLRPESDLINGRYLFYFVQTSGFIDALTSKVRGAHYPAVSDTDVKNVELPLPTIAEQHRIVEILDQAHALRKSRTNADTKAVRILPALFYQMFGDPLLNTKDFERVCLGDAGIAEINPRAPSRDLPNDLEVSFVPMADVNEDWGQITGCQIKELGEVKKGFTSFLENDVLFAKITPCMENGKAAIARGLGNGLGYGSTEFHVLRAGDLVTPEWIYGLTRLDIFRNVAKGNFIGSVGQQRVPADFLRSFRVPLPPKKLIEKFSIVVRELLQENDYRREAEKRISQLVQITMHHAFSGKLTEGWRRAHLKEEFQEIEHQARAGT